MSAFKLRCYRIWIVLSVVLTACESSDSVKNEAVGDLDSNVELLEEMRNEINVGLAQKSAWQKHWESQIGGFDAQSFEFVTTDSIDTMEMPERNPILEGDPLFPYQFPHPDGNGTMDIFSYKVEAQEGLDRPFLNPDSEVIWYRADGMKERLLFMGPSGMFEEGMWLNASEFLVLGYFQEEAGFRPMAWIIDLTNHRFSQFKMNQVVKDYAQESYLDLKLKSVDLGSDGF